MAVGINNSISSYNFVNVWFSQSFQIFSSNEGSKEISNGVSACLRNSAPSLLSKPHGNDSDEGTKGDFLCIYV